MVKKCIQKKKAMTLAALLITMAVTSILLGMFVPLLVQGLVNIASGKEFDGSVSLSRRNGFFMCYYNQEGRLVQSRVDVNPNGRDIDLTTVPAGAAGCEFNVPAWPNSFRVTLIGGGGAGATPSFEVFDEEYELPEDNDCLSVLELRPSINANVASYQFDNSAENFCLISKLLESSNICLNDKVGIELFDYNPQEEQPKTHLINVDLGEKSAEYHSGNNRAMVQALPSYEMECLNGETANGFCTQGSILIQRRDIPSACTAPSFFLTRTRNHIPFGSVVELAYNRAGIRVNVAQGGRIGEITERVVPFFDTENGVLRIRPNNIGAGGEVGVNNGQGGTTSLTLPGGAIMSAAGGLSGDFDVRNFYDEGNIGVIPEISQGGQNGEINRFIPAPLQISNLLRGRGAMSVDETAGNATYPGAGGGGGAILLNPYNNAVVRSGAACVSRRVSMCVQGDDNVYELECSPNLRDGDFIDRNNFETVVEGGNGAPGAVLIAW